MELKKTITYQLQSGKDDEFILDEEYVAFKDDKCYPVYKSTKEYNTGFIVGNVRVIFDEKYETLLDVAVSIFGFRGEYELVKIDFLNDWKKKIDIFEKYKNEKTEL
jgi:hypothetical protein